MIRPRIVSVRTLAFAVFLAAFTSACGSDSSTEPEGLTVADLVGSWKASSALFTNQSNSSQQFDLVAAGGEVRTTVLDQGRARTWVDLGDFSDEYDAQLTLNGNQLTATPAESSRPTRHYTIELTGNRLTMTSSDARFDFSLTGAAAVPATEVVVFVKQ